MFPHNGPQSHDLNIGLMLGRLLQGQETTHGALAETKEKLQRIETRLTDGDKRFDKLEAAKIKPEIGTAERWVKQGLQWAIPGGVLWWTGSIDQALKVLAALGAK